jgi:hypothetical protein
MAKTGPQKYPGATASGSSWYQDNFGGDSMESNVIVWHSTEGTSLPTYSGGSEAPNFTAVPDFSAKKIKWVQHFDFDTSSRALVNSAGGVETNTLNVCQIEVVGTCDPTSHKKWASTQHLYMPDLPDWVVRDLAAFAKWANVNHKVPLTSGVTFKAYPSSYGTSNGVRMSASKWESFKGHCGHQHVTENYHGDPGSFPMAEILKQAGSATPPASTPPASSPAKPKLEPFPGAAWFKKEPKSAVVTAMGKRLVAVGCSAYKDGPGPQWTDVDRASYKKWQQHLGYTGTDADGWPGETSWAKLQVPNV